MRKILLAIMLNTIAMKAHAVPAASVCPAAQPLSNMQITFDSEFFAGQSINPKQWTPFVGDSVGDASLEAQTYTTWEVTTLNQRGLRIKTQPGTSLTRPYESGAVTTKGLFSQLYGHFEASMRLPEMNGMWPAFWMLPANGSWPPEIDILEYIYAPNGIIPAASSTATNWWVSSNPATTIHWRDAYGQLQQAAPMVNSTIDQPRTYQDWKTKSSPNAPMVGYHTYAVDWRPGSVNWLIDGQPVFCVSGSTVSSTAMYMLINDAVSNGSKSNPGWAGYIASNATWPQTMDTAYVRVYRFLN